MMPQTFCGIPMKTRSLLIALTLLLAYAGFAQEEQQERIISYDSDILVNTDGSMLVTEQIRVHAAGDQIKHGIYRDFPTEYKNKLGIRTHIPFDLISVQRDGHDEDYHTASRSNGIRIYIGPRFSNVPDGEHTYTLKYRTDRQIGFFNDRDELFWNVTGNGWIFPIEHASATVSLPTAIPRRMVETYGYTGPQGYQGRDFKARVEADRFIFETTKPLASYEGMSIVCWWDKGYMQPPSSEQLRAWWIEDNQSIVFAVIGLIVVLLYQFVTWLNVGKDPSPGTIMPLYMPPSELSAAGMRELTKMKFDNKAFAACIVSMAAKKYVTIEKDALDAYSVTRSSDPKLASALNSEERLVADRLFANSNHVLLTQSNRVCITEAVKALQKSLQKQLETVYFVRNSGYILPSIALSLVTLIASISTAGSEGRPVALFMLFWLSFWSFGVGMLSLQVINLWKQVLHGGPGAALKAGGAIFMTLFALPFIGGELFGIFTLANATSLITVIVFSVLAGSNFLYHELMKAPTRLGRQILDKIEGFKMFLAATEEDQIKRLAPVNWNSETFNRFLPYAIALEAEEQWASKFSSTVAAATAAAATASVAYSGALAATALGSGFAGSLGDSLSGAISSASVAPGSSSGSSGGGSSGGGGGGGGGGGW